MEESIAVYSSESRVGNCLVFRQSFATGIHLAKDVAAEDIDVSLKVGSLMLDEGAVGLAERCDT